MLEKASITVLRYLRTLRSHTPVHASDVESVLLVELTRLGDVVSALSTVGEFQTVFPGSEIDVMVDVRYAPLLKAMTLPITVHGMEDTAGISGLLHSSRFARELGCTAAASMSPSFRNAVVALTSGSPAVLGYLSGDKSLAPFLKPTPVEAFGLHGAEQGVYDNEHLEERALKVAALGGELSGQRPPLLLLNASVVESIRGSLQRRGMLPEHAYVIIHPFAAWPFRRWPIDRYLACAREAIESFDLEVVLVGLPQEMDTIRSAVELGGHPRLRMFPSDTLLESAVLMAGARVCIGNDSGPLHLAARLGVPVVGLFGPAPPGLTAPRHARGEFLYNKLDCSPCDQIRCVRPHESCLQQITVEETVAAMRRVLHGVSSQPLVAHA